MIQALVGRPASMQSLRRSANNRYQSAAGS
jgi:hypothetical protein